MASRPRSSRKILEEINQFDPGRIVAELKDCSRTRNLQAGKILHAEALECGHQSNLYVANALINMYGKCGSMLDARQVFDRLKHPDVVSWNALLFGYAENGQALTALDLLTRMRSEGPVPDSVTILAAFKACTSLAAKGRAYWGKCRDRGKDIYELAKQTGLHSVASVQNSSIYLFAKCGCMVDARQMFEAMHQPDVVAWSALIWGYAEHGQGATALELFKRMRDEGPAPNSVTFLAAIKACIALAVKGGPSGRAECRKWGEEIHGLAIETGCDSDAFVQSSLVDMYARCGCTVKARQMLDKMKNPSLMTWSALILGYADCGQGWTALELFMRMKTRGRPPPDSVTYLAALKACVSLGGNSGLEECRKWGRHIHKLATENGFASDIKVQNSLIDMYSKCRSMLDAHQVFDVIQSPSVVSWNALILGYAENGQGFYALDLVTKMRTEGPSPDAITFSAALKACGLVGGLEFGRTVHAEIDGLDVVLVTCLVEFYAKCASLVEAQSVFELHAESRDRKTWTALLAGYSNCGDHEAAFALLERMQDAGLLPDSVTFQCILTCCCHAGLVEKGKECFDAMFTKYGVTPDVEHCTCMVDLLGRANRLDDGMALLQRMVCSPDNVTWTTVLGACRRSRNAEVGTLAFQSLVSSSVPEATAYVLMGQIYESRGMQREQQMVMGFRRAWKRPAETCWTNEVGEVHMFVSY